MVASATVEVQSLWKIADETWLRRDMAEEMAEESERKKLDNVTRKCYWSWDSVPCNLGNLQTEGCK